MNKVINRRLITASILLGIGLGGFLDGIILHQLLQVHSMLSAKLPQDTVVNVKISMFWDGVFHLFTWITTVSGLGVLWHLLLRVRALRTVIYMHWELSDPPKGEGWNAIESHQLRVTK